MSRPAWRKLGLIFGPDGRAPWRMSHASTPTAEVLEDSLARIYFTSRDVDNRSHIGCVEFDLRNPFRPRNLSAEPLVAPGPPGAFDGHGASMGCLVNDGNRRLLYYVGWNLSDKNVPWRNSIGLSVAVGDSVRFEKVSAEATLGLDTVDSYSISYPWIIREGNRWRMWYGSNLSWGATKDTMQHVIKCAESEDGLRWRRDGHVAIPLCAGEGEIAVSRPCVLREHDRYLMWYSRRRAAYRIGFAESPDGLTWKRDDSRAGIEPGGSGWDGASVEYACVFDAGGERYMLYNGDDYGREGFGLAIRDR